MLNKNEQKQCCDKCKDMCVWGGCLCEMNPVCPCHTPIVSKGEEKKCEHYLHGNAEFFCRGCEHICPGGGVIEKGDDKFCSYFECDFDLRRSLNIPLKAEDKSALYNADLYGTAMNLKNEDLSKAEVSEWDWQSELDKQFSYFNANSRLKLKSFIARVKNQTLEEAAEAIERVCIPSNQSEVAIDSFKKGLIRAQSTIRSLKR